MSDPLSDPLGRVEDPRVVRPGICGATKNTGTIEWVCVRATHEDTAEDDAARTRADAAGLPAAFYTTADNHHFVNRWIAR